MEVPSKPLIHAVPQKRSAVCRGIKMGKNLRAGILFLTITMFWGIIYPQYALTEDMYQVTKDGQRAAKDCPADYRHILTAKREEREIRFWLLEEIETWFGENESDGE